MNDLCIIGVKAFDVLDPLGVSQRAVMLLVILDFIVGSCFLVFSGFFLYAVYSGICISDLLLRIPKLYGLFQVSRLVNSFTTMLTNLLNATLRLFSLCFAFL